MRDLSLDDIKVKRVTSFDFFYQWNFQNIYQVFCIPGIIESKPLDLFNNPLAISRSLSVTVNNTEKIDLVAEKLSKILGKPTVTEQGLVKGDCKCFRELSLWGHSVATSQKEGSLSWHTGNIKKVKGKTVQDLL